MEKFLSDPRIAIAPEPSTIDRHWRSFAVRKTASPKLWMDAYLAAFAVAGGHKFVTTDKAFEQFAGLSPTVLTL